MWWMVTACASGPLDYPHRVDVVVDAPDRGCEARSNHHGEGGVEADITNVSGDERLIDVPRLLEHADEADDYGGVVFEASLDAAALGDDQVAVLRVTGELYCQDGAWPESGRYVRDATLISTDLLGGDVQEQTMHVVVRVE